LNFDVEVAANWLDQAMELMEAEPRLAAVQPKLKQYQNHDNFEYSGGSGGFIDRFGYPFVRGRIFDHIEQDTGQFDDVVPIFWATGAALVVRKSAFVEAGGLDGDFFMHMEELDLCWRWWLTGWEVKVAPRGEVYHWAGAALAADRYHKMYYNHRNGLTMMFKNYSPWNVLKSFPARFLLDWITVFASLLRKEPKRSLAVLASHWYFLTRLPVLIRKRREVQERRRVKDRDYAHVIFPGSIVWRYFVHKQKTYRQITTEW